MIQAVRCIFLDNAIKYNMNLFIFSRYKNCYRTLHLQNISQNNEALYRCLKFKTLTRKAFASYIPRRCLSDIGFYNSLSTSTPVLLFQNFLIDMHQFLNLPWWSVILLTTLGIRLFIVFPLAVHQNQVVARLANLNLELGKMAPELNKEVNIAAKLYDWDEVTAKRVFRIQMREYHHKFVVRDNCHPFKIVLLAVFQIPVWIFFSVSLRNLTFLSSSPLGSELMNLHLEAEGILWFPDLTVPDAFLIPALLLSVNLILIEVHSLRQLGKGTKLQKYLLYGMRIGTIVVAVAATINPSSVSFYWLCSSTFGLVQSLLLMLPSVRRGLKIPVTLQESATPFKDIIANFKKRFIN